MGNLERKISKCQRCGQGPPPARLLRLYIGLAYDTNHPAGPLPLHPMHLNGGILEICVDCYTQFQAATKTWFELATQNAEGVQ